MKQKRTCFALQILLAALLLGAALLVHAKRPLPDSPLPSSGGKPVPCEEVQVCGNTTTYNNCDYRLEIAGTQESGVRRFFAAFGSALRLDETKLHTADVKSGLTGTHFRFEQVYESRRVFGAEVSASVDRNARIRKISSSYFPIDSVLGGKIPTVTAEAAEAVGRAAIGKPVGAVPTLRQPTRSELVWFPVTGTGAVLLVWELMIHSQLPFPGDYLTLVDAGSGVLLHQEDRLAMSN
ncbi:MAG: hypothetical protein WAW41_08755 [Methylobacter sp.]